MLTMIFYFIVSIPFANQFSITIEIQRQILVQLKHMFLFSEER